MHQEIKIFKIRWNVKKPWFYDFFVIATVFLQQSNNETICWRSQITKSSTNCELDSFNCSNRFVLIWIVVSWRNIFFAVEKYWKGFFVLLPLETECFAGDLKSLFLRKISCPLTLTMYNSIKPINFEPRIHILDSNSCRTQTSRFQ